MPKKLPPTPRSAAAADRRILAALASLDDEAWLALMTRYVSAWTQTAGGYRDQAGIAALRQAIDARVALLTGEQSAVR